ncbi:MAG: hypothetical protein ABSD89_05980 [Halobacteriota archaeon]|jgi:hypothetical protein
MLKESDEQWLHDTHPALIPAGNSITGAIEFRASYGQQSNRFSILADHAADPIDAVTLSDAFQIRIEERSDKSDSRLPALYVQGIDPTPERHFNQRDKSACLCSPFDENDFLEPEFQFRPFFEQLVIPFLYGQVFCSSKGHWPWAEYAHGATGILEAYSKVRDQNRAQQCLQKLAQDMSWPKIQSALRQKPYVKGHTPCFCLRMDQIRRCHPVALEGALRLQRDLRALGIPIP